MKFLGEVEDMVYKNGYGLSDEQQDFLMRFFSSRDFNANGVIFAFDDDKLKEQNEYMIKYIKGDRCKILQAYGLSITPETYDEVINTRRRSSYNGKNTKSI